MIRAIRGAGLGLALSLVVSTGRAAEPAKENSLVLQPIGLPVMSKGVLVNYVFVTLKLMLATGHDPTKVHEREPFVRDQIVRMSTRHPFNTPADLTRLDDPRLKTAVLAICRNVYGPGAVSAVQVVTESPQRRGGLPGGTVAPLD